jgi:hypothetical protein
MGCQFSPNYKVICSFYIFCCWWLLAELCYVSYLIVMSAIKQPKQGAVDGVIAERK